MAVKRERVMVIGGPGSGKTWFAERLSRRTGLPLFSVDDAVHRETGARRPASEIDSIVTEWTSGDAWIIEGGNSRTYAERASRATIIVRLRPSRWLRFLRVLLRDGWNVQLLRWSVKYDTVFGPKDCAAMRQAMSSASVYTLQTEAEINRLLDDLSRQIAET